MSLFCNARSYVFGLFPAGHSLTDRTVILVHQAAECGETSLDTRQKSQTWSGGIAIALLAVLLTACGNQSVDQMEGGSGSSSAPSATEKADESTDGSADNAQSGERCFAGDWQVDQTSDAWQVPAGDADEVTGTFSVSFSADGSFQMNFDEWFMHEVYHSGASTGESYVDTTWDGTLSGQYVVDEAGAATLEVAESSLTLDQTQVMFGEVVEEDSGIMPIDDEPIPLIYTCDGDRLIGFPVIEPDRAEPWVAYDRVKGS